jgi:hypothetical protein
MPIREDFDANLWAENKTIKAEQVQDGIISLFISGYEDFWGVDGETSRHSRDQMQAIITAMPAALDILTDAVKFKTFANTAFPGKLADKYDSGVFAITIDGNGVITVGDLNEAWVPVVPEEEVVE